ncbi:MAG TPA: sulfotransferase [Candidatus Limnocylindria bacterium]
MAARPDFFIVGAPKTGTTSLHHYLRQHPQVFMPAVKELNFFGSDRQLRNTPRLTLQEYLSVFAPAPAGVRIGEASVSYLRSNLAAREIAEFAPGAQAIAMLRDPVEVMHALHTELVFMGSEDLTDFGEALAAEADRREGRRIPAAANNPRAVLYREAVAFSEQLQRYFDVLGRDRVHVIIFDDFKADTAASVRDTFRFLDVADAFQPTLEVVNPAKVPRLRVVQRLLSSPPGWLRRGVRGVIPRPTRKRIYRRVSRLNARAKARGPMAPELRAELVGELLPEIARLEAMLGRDLSAWKRT